MCPLKTCLIGLSIICLGITFHHPLLASECDGDFKPYEFPIVLNPPSEFLDEPISQVRVFSKRNNKWHARVVQIDEKSPSGDYVLEHGIPYTARLGTGFLKKKDEIVLRSEDLGDPFTLNEIPKSLRSHVSKMGRAQVCLKKKKIGFFLLAVEKKESLLYLLPPEDIVPLPLSSPRAVSFDPHTATVKSSYFRYMFPPSQPMLLGSVFLGNDLQAAFISPKFTMPIRPNWWFIPQFSFEDSDFSSAIECWRAGPIRTIVAVGAKMSHFLGLFKFHFFSELVFYEKMFQIPTIIEFIFDAAEYLHEGSGLAYSLSFTEGNPWKLTTNLSDLPHNPEDLYRLPAPAKAPEFEILAESPKGQEVIISVNIDPKARGEAAPPALIRKNMFSDDAWLKKWPWLADKKGDFGVYLDLARVKKGIYDFSLSLYLSEQSPDPSLKEKTFDLSQYHIDWLLF